MFAEFKHTLRHMRGQLLGWVIGITLYSVLMASFYDSIAKMDEIYTLLKDYPQEIMAFFGDSIFAITKPDGYLDLYFFGYMAVIIGVLAAAMGNALLVSDEEKGILDLVLAYPVSRSALFWGRVAGFVSALALILFTSWFSWLVTPSSLGLSWIELLRPFLPLMALLLFFGSLALLLSMLLPSVRSAGTLCGGLLIANYLLIGLSNMNENLKAMIEYTPLYYYQGGDAIFDLNWVWLGGLLGAAIIFTLLAWWRFQRRDIRVGGEGGWRLPALSQLLRR